MDAEKDAKRPRRMYDREGHQEGCGLQTHRGCTVEKERMQADQDKPRRMGGCIRLLRGSRVLGREDMCTEKEGMV